MSNEVKTQTAQAPGSAATPEKKRGGRKLSAELGILLILVGIAALFEIAGWVFKGDTFLFNPQRLFIIVLQVSVVGLLAIAVTQVIITGGIDLSSGSGTWQFRQWWRQVWRKPRKMPARFTQRSPIFRLSFHSWQVFALACLPG